MSADRAEAVRVGRMRWWDLEAVGRIEADRFGDQAWSAAQLWAELARVPESRRYVVARSAGEVLGYAGLFLVRPEADVQTIAVARGAQGRGIGRALLTALADQARTAGADVLHLEVRADNAAARSLYAAFGFRPDGRRRDYYGPGSDAVLMSLRLAGHRPRPGGADA